MPEPLFKIVSVCKGGKYMFCRTDPMHPKATHKGVYHLHRVVMENKLGRILRSDEDVHHIDHDRMNNHPDNLEVLTRAEHLKKHRPDDGPITLTCPCGREFTVAGYLMRVRMKRSKCGVNCCSHRCARLLQLGKIQQVIMEREFDTSQSTKL